MPLHCIFFFFFFLILFLQHSIYSKSRNQNPIPLHCKFFFFFFFLILFLQLSISKSLIPQFPCQPPHHNSYCFCNKSFSVTARAHSLISLLTLQEKILQLSNNASGIPRLGIPPYKWRSESLHGIATNGPGVSFESGLVSSTTGFPQVILSTAAFNRTFWFIIGSVVTVEARAIYNIGQAGLMFWAHNINVFRDSRWERGQETHGEDPMVASTYAIEYVKGFQGGNWKIGGGGADRGSGGGFGERRVLRSSRWAFVANILLLMTWRNGAISVRYSFNVVVLPKIWSRQPKKGNRTIDRSDTLCHYKIQHSYVIDL